MSETVEVNELTTTCLKCGQKILNVYRAHSEAECELNEFQAMVDKEGLRWTPLTEDMLELLSTEHNFPVRQFTFKTGNGFLMGVFVSKQLLEVIASHKEMPCGMTLAEFVVAMVSKVEQPVRE